MAGWCVHLSMPAMLAAQTTRVFAPARLHLRRSFRPLTVRTMAAKVCLCTHACCSATMNDSAAAAKPLNVAYCMLHDVRPMHQRCVAALAKKLGR